MSSEPKRAFNAVVQAYETWRAASADRKDRPPWEPSPLSFMRWDGRARCRTSLSSGAAAGARMHEGLVLKFRWISEHQFERFVRKRFRV
jgi:hypothetical protein